MAGARAYLWLEKDEDLWNDGCYWYVLIGKDDEGKGMRGKGCRSV
jgi:hypothetical protein